MGRKESKQTNKTKFVTVSGSPNSFLYEDDHI